MPTDSFRSSRRSSTTCKTQHFKGSRLPLPMGEFSSMGYAAGRGGKKSFSFIGILPGPCLCG